MQPTNGQPVKTAAVTTSDGVTFILELYRTLREKGRRIIIRDADAAVLFDTGDCYDLGNAMYSITDWLESKGVAVYHYMD